MEQNQEEAEEAEEEEEEGKGKREEGMAERGEEVVVIISVTLLLQRPLL